MFRIMSNFIIIILALLTHVCIIKANTIFINNQNDFDNLKSHILKNISAGEKDIYVNFKRGTYTFKDNHIVISRVQACDTKIHIIGNGATLIPQGHTYHSGNVYEGIFTYDNSWMCGSKDVSIWTRIRYADNLVEIVNEKTKLCRLRSNIFINCSYESDLAYIQVTHWFQSSIYKIERIEGSYVYFTASDLSCSTLNSAGYNINDDFYFFKTNPRFRLCNVETYENVLKIKKGKVVLPNGCREVYEGKGSRFFTIQLSSLGEVDIIGLNFYGNKYQASTSYIYLLAVESKTINIRNCSFIGLHGNPISIVNTDNVSVEENSFMNCYYGGILSDNMSAHSKVKNNTFENMGLRLLNTFAVLCRGTDYYISGNTLHNYGSGGISVGDWSNYPHDKPSCGVVENNSLTFSQDYIKEIEKNGLMDSGAIYIWTKNDGAIIKNNVINGYSGAGGNKGIFCDNGSYGVSIIGNLIIGVANSYCITSRRVAIVEETRSPGTGIIASNINNEIRDNIVDGAINFVGHERPNNGCVIGDNYILLNIGQKMPVHSISNVKEDGNIIALEYKGTNNDCIRISKQSYKTIKKSREWKMLKKFVERD